MQSIINQTKDTEDSGRERVRAQEEMLAKYTKQKFTVVLTGSTGSLGSYLLDYLLASPRVSKVICLNRGHNSEERQKTVNISRGLISEWDGKATFLGIELGKPRLGLDEDGYNMLVNEASVILRKSLLLYLYTWLTPEEKTTSGKSISTSVSSPSSPTLRACVT